MKKNKQLTSTERLLEIIRAGSRPATSDNPGPEKSSRPGKQPSFLRRLSGVSLLGSPSSVGIDIRTDAIYLVKVRGGGRAEKRVLGHLSLPLPPGTSRFDAQFSEMLKEALQKLCGRKENVSLWAAIPPESCDVKRFVIPRVPPAKMPDVVFWNIKKSLDFNEKDHLWDFEIQEEIPDGDNPKVAVLAFTALKRDIEGLKTFFREINWPLDGLTLIPLAIQNLFRLHFLDPTQGPKATLSIGHDSSRIEVFQQGHLFLTRNIKTGVNSLKELLLETFEERRRAPQGNHLSPIRNQARPNQHLLDQKSLDSATDLYDMASRLFGPLETDEYFKLIQPALDRLVRQVMVTFDHFHAGSGHTRIDQVYLSSVIGPYEPFLAYLHARLETRTATLDPFSAPGLALIDDKTAEEPTAAQALALGLALSDRLDTANVLFTFREKLQEKRQRLIGNYVTALFVALVAVSGAIFIYLAHDIGKTKGEINVLYGEQQKMAVRIDQETLVKQLGSLKQKTTRLATYGDRIYPLAPLAELTHLTPPEIGLSQVKMTLNPPPAQGGPGKATPAAARGQVTLTGVVNPKVALPDKALADYVLKLEASPLFSEVIISQSTANAGPASRFLNFTLEGKLK
jgi:Tfp pilus assembly PilM family ATPase/Tfp pilus assembly protein PilN